MELAEKVGACVALVVVGMGVVDGLLLTIRAELEVEAAAALWQAAGSRIAFLSHSPVTRGPLGALAAMVD